MATVCLVCGSSLDGFHWEPDGEPPDGFDPHEPGCPYGITPGTVVQEQRGENCLLCGAGWVKVFDGQEVIAEGCLGQDCHNAIPSEFFEGHI